MAISLRGLQPEVRERAQLALDIAAFFKVPVTVTSAARPWAEQVALRNRFEACLARGERVQPLNPNPACRFPANRPGDSSHNFGLAFDSWVPPQFQEWWILVRRWVGFTVPPITGDWVHAEVPQWRQFVMERVA